MNTCPVCAYTGLEFPPTNYSICACCGTEFGYDDRVLSHAELTRRWVAAGRHWFDEDEPKPFGWNAYMQLIQGNLGWAVPRYELCSQTDVIVELNGRLNFSGKPLLVAA